MIHTTCKTCKKKNRCMDASRMVACTVYERRDDNAKSKFEQRTEKS